MTALNPTHLKNDINVTPRPHQMLMTEVVCALSTMPFNYELKLCIIKHEW